MISLCSVNLLFNYYSNSCIFSNETVLKHVLSWGICFRLSREPESFNTNVYI